MAKESDLLKELLAEAEERADLGTPLLSMAEQQILYDQLQNTERAKRKIYIEAREKKKAKGAKPKALVVDDSMIIRARIRRLLEKIGYLVDEAEDGDEVLELIEVVRDYRLITLDYCMPGMNGLQVMQQLRLCSYRSDVIFVSADGDKNVIVESIRLGAMGYVEKPYRNEQLEEQIKRLKHLKQNSAVEGK